MNTDIYEIKGWQKEYIEKNLGEGFEKNFFEDIVPEAGNPDTEALCVFVNSNLNKKTLTKYPKLKFITTRSTGFNHIDLDYCKEKGISVSNVPSYGKNTVAEHAFALLLTLSKNIPQSIQRTRRSNFSYDDLVGFDLNGKTLGVIGTGKIGMHSVKIGSGFGMKVIASDPNPNAEEAKKVGFEYVNSLDELLAKSDVITIHVPLVDGTFHLINKDNIQKVKKGAVLINTARGEIVETDALIWALENGTLSGAGLDVLEGENALKDELGQLARESKRTLKDYKTLVEDHILMDMDNVVVTPHNAFNTKEALERILETTVANLKGFTGGKPVNLVSAKP